MKPEDDIIFIKENGFFLTDTVRENKTSGFLHVTLFIQEGLAICGKIDYLYMVKAGLWDDLHR